MDKNKLKEALDTLYAASGSAPLNRQQHEVVNNAARAIMEECGLGEQSNGSSEPLIIDPEIVTEKKKKTE